MGNAYINCEVHGERQEIHVIGKAGEHVVSCEKCFNHDPTKYVSMLSYSEQLSWRMNNQDNRATASPYLYVLQEQKKVYANDFENPDGAEYYDDDNCTSYNSKKSARESFRESGYEDIEKQVEKLKRIEFKFYWEDVNWFFTKEALDRHINGNRHRYGKTRDYVKHCFRNPEMEYVQKLLKGEL